MGVAGDDEGPLSSRGEVAWIIAMVRNLNLGAVLA